MLTVFIFSISLAYCFTSATAAEQCGKAPIIAGAVSNTSIATASFPVGTILVYRCRIGFFVRDGSVVAVCKMSEGKAQWEQATLECTIRSCPIPERIDHGNVNDTLFVYNSVVTYNCDRGYKINPPKFINICLASGRWSRSKPTCQAVTCNDLASPSHGVVTYTSTKYNAEASYKCDSGYQLIGVSVRKCDADGNWTKPAPTCKDQSHGTCKNAPKYLPYGYIVVHGTGLNDILEYVCYDGKTESIAHCQSNGLWSSDPPTCPEVITTTVSTTVSTKTVGTTKPSHKTDDIKTTPSSACNMQALNIAFVVYIMIVIVSLN